MGQQVRHLSQALAIENELRATIALRHVPVG